MESELPQLPMIATTLSFIPNFDNATQIELKNYFNSFSQNADTQRGIEQLMNNADSDLSEPIIIPFKNKFYCKSEKGGFEIIDELAFGNHFNYFKQSDHVRSLLTSHGIEESTLQNIFREAIKWDNKSYFSIPILHFVLYQLL
jgi:hypothetical protein